MICLQDSVIVLNGNYDNTCTSPPSYKSFFVHKFVTNVTKQMVHALHIWSYGFTLEV